MQMNYEQATKMYKEWAAFNPVERCNQSRQSVLHKFPQINGTGMVNSCVKPMAAVFSSGHYQEQTNQGVNYLENDREVLWIMEVICYGLSMPLSTNEQHEAVRDCVQLYCEWLTALTPAKAKSKSIPFPIREDANLYCRKIIEHLYNIFIPRVHQPTGTMNQVQESNLLDVISRQALLCHRILRTIECVAHDETNFIDKQTWDTLLTFLLAVNDTLLAPPVEPNDIGTQLSERIVSVLFDIWIIACNRCFPSPSYWKTFQQLSCSWRHRSALIDQWNSINLVLTQKLVQNILPNLITQTPHQLKQNFIKHILDEMNEETVRQTWFRFLHTIGNPVDLCYPEIISKTDKFYHSACASENVVDPRQHPCLNYLPHIFYKAMKGISVLVDLFLGIPVHCEDIDTEVFKSTISVCTSPKAHDSEPNSTPPTKQKTVFPMMNKGAAKTSFAHSKSAKSSETHLSTQQFNLPIIIFPSFPDYNLSPSRPKSTSILDIFGDWLFQAALFGLETKEQNNSGEVKRSASSTSFNQFLTDSRKSSGISDRITIDTLSLLSKESFEAGQAEAIGALCRLFCFKRSDEEISKILSKKSHPAFQKVKEYLTKFHLALQYGLTLKEPLKRQILASILINSTKIFQIDLPGASLLIPHFLKALEIYLIPKEKSNIKSEVDIRRACIKILLSLLSYPHHFEDLPIKDTLTETTTTTFHSLKPRLTNLLIQSFYGEQDSTNIQMILGGFLLVVYNATFCDSNSEIDTRTNSLTNESLATESSSSLQFSSHHNEPSYDSSLASADVIFSDDGKGIPDTPRGLFVRSIYYIGQILSKAKEKTNSYDSHVWLCALEVLSALGRIHMKNEQKNTFPPSCFIECKETTRQICVFIEHQCEKPAPFHSKDMHSTIVAAYQCLAVWFQEHPHLLKDKECVSILLEVIELGISGSKSKKNGYIFKADKELKPASMRVREAAEALLTQLMNHFEFGFSTPCPPETIAGASLLDETQLLKQLCLGNNLIFDAACEKFKYFVSDNLIMIGILDQPNDKETACIIRSPFGKYCWSFKQQQLPLKHNLKLPHGSVPRPLPKSDSSNLYQAVHYRYFPESMDKLKYTKFDTMVPTLDNIITSCPELKADYENMLNLIDKIESNMKFEKQKLQKSFLPTKSLECKESSSSSEFEPAKLILSQMGFLTLENLKEPPMGQVIPSLICLNHKNPEFCSNLKLLDSISSRTSDTVFIYYVRKGLTSANDILSSVKNKSLLCKQFKEFLFSLGYMVDVNNHCGWTGHISTAWKVIDSSAQNIGDCDENSLMLDGRAKVLYWADVSHEMAFVLPSGCSPDNNQELDSLFVESDIKIARSISDPQADARSVSSMSDDGSTMSAHSKITTETNGSMRGSLRKKLNLSYNVGCDVKIMVFWLESIDDQCSIPIDSLLSTTGTGVETNLNSWKHYLLIFIYPLNNGLFRITVQGSAGRFPIALPLIDGMVVSKNILGTFIRLTALNIFKRRRLDAESFQPQHVKRRLKIQEIVNRFRLPLSEPEFYNSLFHSK